MLRSLPVQEPDRLAVLGTGQGIDSWTYPIWEQVRDRSDLFDGAFAWSSSRFNLRARRQTELVDGILGERRACSRCSACRPILGRTFTEADDRRGGGPDGPVAVISYRFWQRRFDGAADVLGQTLTVERVPFTIVGVTPPDFFGIDVGRTFDVAIPIGTEPLIRGKESSLDRRSNWWLNVMVAAEARTDRSMPAPRRIRGVQPQIREATMPQDWRAARPGRDTSRRPSRSFPPANGNSGLRRSLSSGPPDASWSSSRSCCSSRAPTSRTCCSRAPRRGATS